MNDHKHIDVVGYDDEGNLFSSMDGFRFDWSVIDGLDHIKMTPKPEGYRHKRVQESTDMQYVKGLTPGEARVKVLCLEPGYEHILPVEVTTLVIDPFVIEPQDPVYLLPTTRFDFSLLKLNKQETGEVKNSKV